MNSPFDVRPFTFYRDVTPEDYLTISRNGATVVHQNAWPGPPDSPYPLITCLIIKCGDYDKLAADLMANPSGGGYEIGYSGYGFKETPVKEKPSILSSYKLTLALIGTILLLSFSILALGGVFNEIL
ncbi:hypothetical protein JC221_028 [Yersinia phage JC221]|nr:hypothetical protein JC221_028 [Yersinia phage JC221]